MKKVIIAFIVILFVVAGTYVGARLYKRHKKNSNPVNVYSLEEYGDSSWYEDDSSSMSGTISSTGNQKIYLDSSKQLKEIYVKVGDKVKAGQEILKYDDAQARLNIESMYNELEVTKAELTQAYNELEKLKKKKPTEKTTQKKTEATTQKKTTEATTEEPTPEPTATPSPSPTPEVTPTPSNATNTDATPKNDPSTEKNTEETTEKKKKKKKKKTTEDTTEATTEATTQYNIPDDKDKNKNNNKNDDDDDDEEYTEYELSLAITRQNEEIKSIQNDIDNQNLAIRKAERSLDSEAIVAKISGTVTQVITADESRASGSPLVIIKSDGSYWATVSVGEYELAGLEIGTIVSVYCYDTGNRYPGTIVSIGVNPVGESTNNFVQSYYPVKVSIDPNDDLTDGSYVEVSIDKSDGTDNIDQTVNQPDVGTATDADATPSTPNFSEYTNDTPDDGKNDIVIPLFFVKKEGNRYYVMKEHKGRLKKQYINTGKIYYNTEIAVTGGITSSDWIAFPYDKNAVEGKVCREADSDDLY